MINEITKECKRKPSKNKKDANVKHNRQETKYRKELSIEFFSFFSLLQ
jgi:hypothetical protein